MELNLKQYNTRQYNGGRVLQASFSTNLAVFGGFSISDGVYMIVTDLLDSGPTREIVGGRVPRDDGEYVTADYWREKVIEVAGIVKDTTSVLLDARLETIRKNLRTREANLDITRGTVVRRYVATLSNMDELFAARERWHITFCPFRARFICKVPFAKARSYTDYTETLTVSPSSISIENVGTYKSKPSIIMIFTAVNTVTVVNVKRVDSSGTTLEEIEYSGTIAVGDVLEFSSESLYVKKNGTSVQYVGSFLTTEVGTNIYKFTVTATSFSADTTIKYKQTFL